jgi:hypothetical protein
MNRLVFAPAVTFVLCSTAATFAFAQAQPAAPVAPVAPVKAKFAAPLKGAGTIDVLKSNSNVVGKEIVTKFKIKNTSNAPLALVKVDEYWYDKAGKLVSSDTQRHRQPLPPGEIVELETRSPAMPGAERANWTFSHVNGTLKATSVKAMK